MKESTTRIIAGHSLQPGVSVTEIGLSPYGNHIQIRRDGVLIWSCQEWADNFTADLTDHLIALSVENGTLAKAVSQINDQIARNNQAMIQTHDKTEQIRLSEASLVLREMSRRLQGLGSNSRILPDL